LYKHQPKKVVLRDALNFWY